VSGKLNIWIFI